MNTKMSSDPSLLSDLDRQTFTWCGLDLELPLELAESKSSENPVSMGWGLLEFFPRFCTVL